MAQNITLMGASYSAVPAVTLPKTGGGTATFTDVTDTTAAASDVASGKYFYTSGGVKTQGTNSGGGGSATVATKTATATNYPTSLSFTGLGGQPKAFFVRPTNSITVSTSSSSSYYYIVSMVYDGTNTKGSCLRMGSTRNVSNITSGYSFTYSNGTLTLSTSAASRSASPGAFYGGSGGATYELVYVY